ncbi:MAG: hypothetical protein PHS07_03505 [Patescibacteria group bacterium]|nr:hypothetical protein [Patescibacteria group bacterium]
MDLKNKLAVLTYFDIFNFPLTEFELQKWQFQKDFLPTVEVEKNIQQHNGFYFLKNRSEIIQTRLTRYSIAEKKFKKVIKISKVLRWIPFIKMIAVCNSLSYSNATVESDIDLFIITQKNRIWLTRFLAVSWLKIFKLRPRENDTQDKICLSFFVSEDSLNLEKLLLPAKNNLSDIHFIYWLSQFKMIYDKDRTWIKFTQANEWLKKYLPNFEWAQSNLRRQIKTIKLPSFWGGWLEKIVRKYQLKILPVTIKDKMNQNSNVVVNDQILKLHTNDRREEYRDKFKNKIFQK